MRGGSWAAAREVVPKRLDCFGDLTMQGNENRDTSGADQNFDYVVGV
jgi:hypothetical protein